MDGVGRNEISPPPSCSKPCHSILMDFPCLSCGFLPLHSLLTSLPTSLLTFPPHLTPHLTAHPTSPHSLPHLAPHLTSLLTSPCTPPHLTPHLTSRLPLLSSGTLQVVAYTSAQDSARKERVRRLAPPITSILCCSPLPPSPSPTLPLPSVHFPLPHGPSIHCSSTFGDMVTFVRTELGNNIQLLCQT